MQHCITFAREQRIHAHSGFSRHLLEALSIQFVRDEYFAVLVRQFVERQFQFVEKQTADVDRFRPGIRRWQQILDLEQLAFFALGQCVGKILRLVLAEKIRDAIARHAKKRSEEHTSELQSHSDLVCRLLLEKKKR